jgi:hypothetical protein
LQTNWQHFISFTKVLFIVHLFFIIHEALFDLLELVIVIKSSMLKSLQYCFVLIVTHHYLI